MDQFCSGRAPIYMYSSFYRPLNLAFTLNVGGITRNNQVTTALGTGSLEHAVGFLCPYDFENAVDTDSEKSD